jgi:hypothetical protein
MGAGNYWSDYEGADDGSNSRVSQDGIGDTDIPHPTTDNGDGYFILDNFPLMEIYPDISPPEIQLISPENNSVFNPGLRLDFEVEDSHLDWVKHSINNGLEVSLSSPYSISTFGWLDGTYNVTITANDSNNNTAKRTYFFSVDTKEPSIILNSPENNTVISSGSELDFSIVDLNSDQVIYSINEGSDFILPFPFNISTLGWLNGNYSVMISALDLAGNSNASWYFFTIDSTKPLILLNSPENEDIIPKGKMLDFSVIDENLINVNCSINGAGIQFLDPFDISTSEWADGTYSVQINAQDQAGNENSAMFFFTIDSTLPLISSVSVIDITENSATIVWITDKSADSRVIYSINSDLTMDSFVHDSKLTTSHSITLTSLNPDQIYYYEVRSQSATGNQVIENNDTQYYAFRTLPQSSQQDNNPKAQIFDGNWWLFLVMAFIIVIIVILILKRRKGKPTEESPIEDIRKNPDPKENVQQPKNPLPPSNEQLPPPPPPEEPLPPPPP